MDQGRRAQLRGEDGHPGVLYGGERGARPRIMEVLNIQIPEIQQGNFPGLLRQYKELLLLVD